MKRLKFLPSVLMLVLCVGVLCMGIYAASPNSNQITGSITINPANAAVDILYWAEKADGTQSTKIPLTDVRNGGETINFNNTTTFGDFLKLNFGTADEIGDVEPCYIKIQITNKSSSKELGVYFSKSNITTTAIYDDIFKTEHLANCTSVDATSKEVYGWLDKYAQDATSNTTTLTLEFKANAFIESGDAITFNGYYLNIEEYVATYDQLTAGRWGEMADGPYPAIADAPAFVKLSSSITTVPTYCFGGASGYGASTQMKMIVGPKVLAIEDTAFRGCTGLTELRFEWADLTIGGNAFEGCTNIQRLKFFNKGDILIKANAFSGCTNLQSLNFLNTGTISIKANAFSGCMGLAEIKFNGTDLTIEGRAFANCSQIQSVEVLSAGNVSVTPYFDPSSAAFPIYNIGKVKYKDVMLAENKVVTFYAEPDEAAMFLVGYARKNTLVIACDSDDDIFTNDSGSSMDFNEVIIKGVNKTIKDGAFGGNTSGYQMIQYVTLEEGVEDLGANIFTDVSKQVNLPSTLKSIGTTPFGKEGLTINYNGTMAQFNGIEGKENILCNYPVICTDGTIAKTA